MEVKRPNVKTYLPNHHSINILEQLSWLDIRTLWLWVIKIFQRSNDHLECSVQICSMPCIEPWMDEWLTYLVTDRNFKWRHLGFWESALALSLSLLASTHWPLKWDITTSFKIDRKRLGKRPLDTKWRNDRWIGDQNDVTLERWGQICKPCQICNLWILKCLATIMTEKFWKFWPNGTYLWPKVKSTSLNGKVVSVLPFYSDNPSSLPEFL